MSFLCVIGRENTKNTQRKDREDTEKRKNRSLSHTEISSTRIIIGIALLLNVDKRLSLAIK